MTIYLEELKEHNLKDSLNYLKVNDQYINEAILIRLVEQKFLNLFSEGKMNGTVHTCVGQEFSGVAVCNQLKKSDWVTSNHRCHGHFIAKTKNWRGLIDELMGLESGVCKGVGSSQHLFAEGFLSNGPQAALVPVATGIALHSKINNTNNISASFIGEGTLGEGAVYEAMNLASLYNVPQLFVCENNFYSQSTPQQAGVSGSILKRPESFGIKTFIADTWDLANLFAVAESAIQYVRSGKPAFLLIKTYRLNAHSKGDDDRDINEVNFFKEHDPINQLLKLKKWQNQAAIMQEEIDIHIASSNQKHLNLDLYKMDQLPRSDANKLSKVKNNNIRMVAALNQAYKYTLEHGAFHIGEDIEDPYGGAFKVTKGLSTLFPEMVKNTPISEAGLIGVAIGMSLMGTPSFAEIMFGDFLTHAMDQLISNASKFRHMYALQTSVPVRIRTPMGGKRGYGPTHSQSLEKFFVGIDNITVLALTSLCDPAEDIKSLSNLECPAIICENKVDYGKYLWQDNIDIAIEREDKPFGALKAFVKHSAPTVTIVSYGETARMIADNMQQIFVEVDVIPELICLTLLHPLDVNLIKNSLKSTKKLITVEDGSISFGIGAEIISKLVEENIALEQVKRIGADPVPIPSVADLENQVLPTLEKIIKEM